MKKRKAEQFEQACLERFTPKRTHTNFKICLLPYFKTWANKTAPVM